MQARSRTAPLVRTSPPGADARRRRSRSTSCGCRPRGHRARWRRPPSTPLGCAVLTIDAALRTDTSGTGHGGERPSPPDGAAGWTGPRGKPARRRKGRSSSTPSRRAEAPRRLHAAAPSALRRRTWPRPAPRSPSMRRQMRRTRGPPGLVSEASQVQSELVRRTD